LAPAAGDRLLEIGICHFLETVNAVIVGSSKVLNGRCFSVVGALLNDIFGADGGRTVMAVGESDVVDLFAEASSQPELL